MGPPLLFVCPICHPREKGTPKEPPERYTFSEVLEHLASAHVDRFTLYHCPTCQKGFGTPFTVHDHIRKECRDANHYQTEFFTKNLLQYDPTVIQLYLKHIEQTLIDRVVEEGRRKSSQYEQRIREYVDEVSELKARLAARQPVPGTDFKGLSATVRSPPPPGIQPFNRRDQMGPGSSRQAVSCERSPRMQDSRVPSHSTDLGSSSLQARLLQHLQGQPVNGRDQLGPEPSRTVSSEQTRVSIHSTHLGSSSQQAVLPTTASIAQFSGLLPHLQYQAVNGRDQLGSEPSRTVSSEQPRVSIHSTYLGSPSQQAVPTLTAQLSGMLPSPPLPPILIPKPPSEPAADRPIKQEPGSPGYGYSPIPDHFPIEEPTVPRKEEPVEELIPQQPARKASPPPPRPPSPNKRFVPKIVQEEKLIVDGPSSSGQARGQETQAKSSQSHIPIPAPVTYTQWAEQPEPPAASSAVKKDEPKSPTETKPQPTNCNGMKAPLSVKKMEQQESFTVPAVEQRYSHKSAAPAAPSKEPTTTVKQEVKKTAPAKPATKQPIATAGNKAAASKASVGSKVPLSKATSPPKPAESAETKPQSGSKTVPKKKKAPVTLKKTVATISESRAPELPRRPPLTRFEVFPSVAAGPSGTQSPKDLVILSDDELVTEDEDSEEEGEIVEIPVQNQEVVDKPKEKKRNIDPKKTSAQSAPSRKRRGSDIATTSSIKAPKRQKYVRFETEFHVCAYENCCKDLNQGPCAFCYGHHLPEDCATFIDFDNRRLSCLLTTFCYHCLKYHPIHERCVHVPCRFCRRNNHHAAFCRSKDNSYHCGKLQRIANTKRLPLTPHLAMLFSLREAARQIVNYDSNHNPHWIRFSEQPPCIQRALSEQFGDVYGYLLNNNPYQNVDGTAKRPL